ncbi:tyrosine recombinase XerD [Clostridium puniceum]|uniref:Tyrosine recombinase XerD n=2 Tax=Clostridium puniceum TaxID=29367 RepID=A0A1S8TVM6_9CLOT|nr:tyrosine recombinase XerD [Clostridium puniceum]
MAKKLIKMNQKNKTFAEAFEDFIFNCKSRNLREDTILHYRKSYRIFVKYIEPATDISTINKKTVDDFIVNLKKRDITSQTICSYTKDLITVLHFFMDAEWIKRFKIESPKVDISPVEIYKDTEIKKLLKKPNMKKCNFTEFQCWTISCLLASTAIRLSSLINIKIQDIDFDNELLKVMHTKNRKSLILPLNKDILRILREYLKVRQGETVEYLFCNTYGKQSNRATLALNMRHYNRKRGCSTGLHRWRHTYATLYIRNNGDITKLQRYLGHSNLLVTERYTHLLMPDLKKDVNDFNI